MNLQEKVVAHKYFQLKIYQKDGYEFQNFFTSIMNKYDSGFMTIKTQGNIGDRKNDGYIPSKGIYFQVYAPEKIDAKEAIEKIENDLNGLMSYWDKLCKVKEYNFVMNDKYKGAYPTINAKILEVGKKYNIKTNLLLASQLENICFQLKDEEIEEILGNIIDVPMENLSFTSLNDVIEGIMKLPFKAKESLISPAEMNEKIKFNYLNQEVSNILNQYSIYTGQLEEYFFNKGEFERERVQQVLTGIYEEAKKQIEDNANDANSIRFFYIVDKITPEKPNISIMNAIYILMSYYFEACDIFLNPNNKEN